MEQYLTNDSIGHLRGRERGQRRGGVGEVGAGRREGCWCSVGGLVEERIYSVSLVPLDLGLSLGDKVQGNQDVRMTQQAFDRQFNGSCEVPRTQ